MKKRFCVGIAVVVLLLGIYLIGSGFVKTGTTYISDFKVSEDGNEMTVNVSVTSSAGYIRKVVVHQQQGGKLYLDCYPAFGGINGSIGAKNEYTISLDKDTEIIALYRSNNCYEEVLSKDANGAWQRVK